MSNFIEPMRAPPIRDLPVGDSLYELKFDGYRALAFKVGKEVRLISRSRTTQTAGQAVKKSSA